MGGGGGRDDAAMLFVQERLVDALVVHLMLGLRQDITCMWR